MGSLLATWRCLAGGSRSIGDGGTGWQQHPMRVLPLGPERRGGSSRERRAAGRPRSPSQGAGVGELWRPRRALSTGWESGWLAPAKVLTTERTVLGLENAKDSCSMRARTAASVSGVSALAWMANHLLMTSVSLLALARA